MALVAEATAAVSTATSPNLELLMDSDGVSLSSSEMSATEGTEVSTEETANVSTNMSEDGNQVIASEVNLIEQIEMEAVEISSVQQLSEDGAEEMTVDPAETRAIVDANNEGANKENSLEESPVILPGNTVEVGSSSMEELCPMSPCEILTEENVVAAEEIKPADSKDKLPEDVKIGKDTKLFGVKTEIDKLAHKSHTGVSSLTDVKKELSGIVCELKRSELESLIVDKFIEAIAIHSDVGALNQKLIQCNTVKDRLFHKVSSLQAQVVELTKAVRSVSENVGRNQKPVNKANQPIRFYRSVGVQVVLDSSPMPLASRQGVQCQQRVDVTNKSVLKSGTNKTPLVSVEGVQPIVTTAGPATANGQPLSVIGNVNPGLKRPLKPTVTVADVANQIDLNKTRRISVIPMGTSTVATPTKTTADVLVNGRSPQSTPVAVRQSPALVTSQPMMRNPAAVAAMNTIQAAKASMEPGIVDLTDDDVTPVTAIPKTIITTSPQTNLVNGKNSNVVLMNGVQYRLNCPQISGPQPVQLITQNGQSYQLIQSNSLTSAQFVRPTIIQAINGQATTIRPVSTTAGTRQIFVGGVVPQSQTTVTPVISGGQIMVRSMKPVTTMTPVQVAKQQQQQQVTITPRLQAPQVVVTTGPSRTTLTNGTIVTRVTNFANSSNTVTRAVAQPVNKVTLKPVEIAKKFVLPPLPPPAVAGNPRRGAKDIPPRPELTLTEQNDGIVLSWNLRVGSNHADIQTYQIYACQEPLFNSQKSGTASWKRVGDVKALPLPMACTLSQFTSENRYHFIVRGVDVYNRTGPFCEASAITLSKKS